MASNEFKLSVRRGPEEGQSFTLSASSVTIGRDPTADIVFSDPEVSRQHARFTRTADGYEVQDLGSTNGTFVDGRRLSGETVSLQPGAVITMGSNVTVVLEAAADPMATVISPDLGREFSAELEQRAQEVEQDAFASFDAPDLDVVGFDDESTSLDFGPASDLPSFDDDDDGDDDDDFSFDFDDDAYSAPALGGYGEERTMLDMDASDLPSFSSPPREDDDLPSFGQSSDLPSFDEPSYERPSGSRQAPPPPPPPPVKETDPNRRRNMIILVVVILLLCCCCGLVASYYWLGDLALEAMNQF